jgi:hypothetical protein
MASSWPQRTGCTVGLVVAQRIALDGVAVVEQERVREIARAWAISVAVRSRPSDGSSASLK